MPEFHLLIPIFNDRQKFTTPSFTSLCLCHSLCWHIMVFYTLWYLWVTIGELKFEWPDLPLKAHIHTFVFLRDCLIVIHFRIVSFFCICIMWIITNISTIYNKNAYDVCTKDIKYHLLDCMNKLPKFLIDSL